MARCPNKHAEHTGVLAEQDGHTFEAMRHTCTWSICSHCCSWGGSSVQGALAACFLPCSASSTKQNLYMAPNQHVNTQLSFNLG